MSTLVFQGFSQCWEAKILGGSWRFQGGPLFLKTGMTFVSLSIVGKQPDSKDRLKRKDRGQRDQISTNGGS